QGFGVRDGLLTVLTRQVQEFDNAGLIVLGSSGSACLALLHLYIRMQPPWLRPQRKPIPGGLAERVLQENEIVEASSGESSKKTKSWRLRRVSPPGKRNRGGFVG